jgi:hypothetical protein
VEVILLASSCPKTATSFAAALQWLSQVPGFRPVALASFHHFSTKPFKETPVATADMLWLGVVHSGNLGPWVVRIISSMFFLRFAKASLIANRKNQLCGELDGGLSRDVVQMASRHCVAACRFGWDDVRSENRTGRERTRNRRLIISAGIRCAKTSEYESHPAALDAPPEWARLLTPRRTPGPVQFIDKT